jgi:hypothetical protein
MIHRQIAASAIVALAVSSSAFAQQPSATTSGVGATPLAWLDDASVLESGAFSVAISTARWSGSGMSEVSIPVVDAAFGLTRRVQFSASVPRVAGAEASGVPSGLGTSYFSTKLALFESRRSGVKLAVSPTLEVLTPAVSAWLGPGEHRVQLGLPVSGEIARGRLRTYAAAGYFSRGAMFMGGGAGIVVNPALAVSAAFSRAWRRTDLPDVPLSVRDRKELSGGVSYAVSPAVRVFGSMSRTIATLDVNGAGTTVAAGASFYVAPRVK